MKNWWIFIAERFPLASYGPMILLYVGAHAMSATRLAFTDFSNWRALVSLLITFSFFFRLRVFDEIKDYTVDLKINPSRPLARGLITISQCHKMLICLILLELGLAASLGDRAFAVHGLAIGYSLLMYNEFFLGSWLRPRLTSYAITHTFVSVLLGLSCLVSQAPEILNEYEPTWLRFIFMNWCFFNLFEFARKTFAKGEERPGVDSYTSLFGPWGAVLLSVSQAVCGSFLFINVLMDPLMSASAWRIPLFGALCVAYSLFAFTFALKPTPLLAQVFRAASGVYLLAHYGLVIWVSMGV